MKKRKEGREGGRKEKKKEGRKRRTEEYYIGFKNSVSTSAMAFPLVKRGQLSHSNSTFNPFYNLSFGTRLFEERVSSWKHSENPALHSITA